ncbi:DUF2383 domain-containing protein [Pseudaestuariivita sp.]|uniref:DUF2383 domain-containing protein n=1 Tax=Pseudaestuariivita sp. TaxID=2211669 RepID=UPI004058B634
MSQSFHRALEKLHARHVDAKAGFDVMVARAEPDFKPVAEKFRDLHARHARQIASLLPDGADLDGSFMSSVNRAVVKMRDFFDEIDEDVMDQVRNGEKRVQRAYSDAIEAAPDEVRPELLRASSELTALIAETRHLD